MPSCYREEACAGHQNSVGYKGGSSQWEEIVLAGASAPRRSARNNNHRRTGSGHTLAAKGRHDPGGAGRDASAMVARPWWVFAF